MQEFGYGGIRGCERELFLAVLVFVHSLLMEFWKVQPSLPKYLELVAKFLYVHIFFFFVIAVRFMISFGFKIIEFKFVSYRCYFFQKWKGKAVLLRELKRKQNRVNMELLSVVLRSERHLELMEIQISENFMFRCSS